MPQTQTADGTGRITSNAQLQSEFRSFNAGAEVQRQRLDAYDGEYAEVAFKGTQKALCLPCGGELHLPEGGVVPVAAWDWVVELPDGTLGSISAEQVADHMEFVSGSDAQREAFEATVQYVENGRKAPGENVDVPVEAGPQMPHPDQFEAAEQQMSRFEQEQLLAGLQAQADQARATLTALAQIAVERGTIDQAEAEQWVDTGVAPQGVHVAFDTGLRSYEITRDPAPVTPTEGGATAVVDGSPDGAGHIDLAAIDPVRVPEPSGS